jgi:hypothetical protein
MPSVYIDNRGETTIVECAGRFVRNEAACKIRDAVTSQTNAHVVVLDLTDMHAIGGLGTLLLLQTVRYTSRGAISLNLSPKQQQPALLSRLR